MRVAGGVGCDAGLAEDQARKLVEVIRLGLGLLLDGGADAIHGVRARAADDLAANGRGARIDGVELQRDIGPAGDVLGDIDRGLGGLVSGAGDAERLRRRLDACENIIAAAVGLGAGARAFQSDCRPDHRLTGGVCDLPLNGARRCRAESHRREHHGDQGG